MSVCFVLVNPQMGENIGFVARAMANFALQDLRIVNPRDGWPNVAANAASSGAFVEGGVQCQVFDTVQDAVSDCHLVLATTARERTQAKQVYGVREAAQNIFQRKQSGLKSAILFGAERSGLSNESISLAHGIITFPVNSQFSSLNLGQAALLVAYELFQSQDDEGELLPFVSHFGSPPAPHAMLAHFMQNLQNELVAKHYFMPADKAEIMQQNLQALIMRMDLTEADVKTLFAVVNSLRNDRG